MVSYMAKKNQSLITRKMPVAFDEKKQLEFLEHLEKCGQVNLAAAKTGVSTTSVKTAEAKNPKFKEALAISKAIALNKLVSVAQSRALDGLDEKIYYRDKEIGTRKVYDNKLLKFLIESLERGSFIKEEAGVNINQNINVSDETTLNRLGSFLNIDINSPPNDSEDAPESQGESSGDDIIEGEYYPTGEDN